jgi:hypothetical protein
MWHPAHLYQLIPTWIETRKDQNTPGIFFFLLSSPVSSGHSAMAAGLAPSRGAGPPRGTPAPRVAAALACTTRRPRPPSVGPVRAKRRPRHPPAPRGARPRHASAATPSRGETQPWGGGTSHWRWGGCQPWERGHRPWRVLEVEDDPDMCGRVEL